MTPVPAGILLPETFLQSEFFQVMATFVAITTLMYVTLAIATMLHRVHPGDWFARRNRRREPRGVIPPPPESP